MYRVCAPHPYSFQVSSNFERLLWFLADQVSVDKEKDATKRRAAAGEQVKQWLHQLKRDGGFSVDDSILEAAKVDFKSERVSDQQTVQTIKDFYCPSSSSPQTNGASITAINGDSTPKPYVLDPHTAIGIAASLRSIARAPPPQTHHISLATAHPAKFANAVQMALEDVEGFDFEREVSPEEFRGLEKMEKRVRVVGGDVGVEGMRTLIGEMVAGEKMR